MLTNLDFELFPDDCEVVEIPSHDLWIYLMQKNGSSSVRKEARLQDWRTYRNHELVNLTHVDVYVRDPKSRFLSGINTYVQHLNRDHPDLHHDTCLKIASKYLFLNRHYLPQWHWIVNLARFIHKDCLIRLHPIQDLESVTNFRSRANIVLMTDKDKNLVESIATNIDLWMLLDEILVGRCGQTMTWQQLLDIYKRHPSEPLDIITNRVFSVANVLR